jgi:hypothetical protein
MLSRHRQLRMLRTVGFHRSTPACTAAKPGTDTISLLLHCLSRRPDEAESHGLRAERSRMILASVECHGPHSRVELLVLFLLPISLPTLRW